MGTLYIVATPIGNLEDVTVRAINVLKKVGLVAAEDTRHTRKLFTRYGISTPMQSYHEHNERAKAGVLLEKLCSGTDVALVTDAGTPGISDPGYRLVALAREKGVKVVPVPGASAVTAVLSIAGLPTDRFTFLGFVPGSKGKKRSFFLELAGTTSTYVMYDAPGRLIDTLGCAREVLGDVEAAVGRELTKLNEEVLRGRVSDILDRLGAGPVKGEVTIVVRTHKPEGTLKDAVAEMEGLLRAGHHITDVVKAVCREYGLKRTEVYKEALAIKQRLGL